MPTAEAAGSLSFYLITAIGALASGIVFLYLQALANHKQCTIREEKCQDDYRKLLERVVIVETERRVYDEIERRVAAVLRPAA